MCLIDLHTHTTYSDGTYTPEALMAYAAKKNLAAIAVTDHDTTAGLKEAEDYARKWGIELVPGVEIAAMYNGMEIHILGYYINAADPGLMRMLADFQGKRNERNMEVIHRLNQAGIPITLADVKAVSGGEILSRAHFGKYLVNEGYVSTVKEAFINYLRKGQIAYVPRALPGYPEVLHTIAGSGGIPVLAHPAEYRLDYYQTDVMAGRLKDAGLVGIEAIYTTNTPEDDRQYRDIAGKHGLLVTGGSDFHGGNKPGLDLGSGYGNLAISYAILNQLKAIRQ